jgi:hypothetical protein
VQLESHKGSYRRSKIKDFKDNKPKSKGQTKDFKIGKYLSGLHNKNSGSKMVYI